MFRPLSLLLSAAILLLLLVPERNSAEAGAVVLKNGTRFEGTPVPLTALTLNLAQQRGDDWKTYPIVMVDTGMKRYFVPRRQVEEVDRAVTLGGGERFKIKQLKTGGRKTPSSLGSFKEVTEFNEHGHRRVTVMTSKGPVHIFQGVTEMTPEFLTVRGLNYDWEFGLTTTSIPPETLDMLLRKATEADKPADRMAIARFYTEAGMYLQADAELNAIAQQFPEYAERIKEQTKALRQHQANTLLRELRRRRQNGQHELAYKAARKFPRNDMDAAVLRQVDDLEDQYKTGRNKIDKVNVLLGQLQAQVSDDATKSSLIPLRNELRAELGFNSIDRLESFLTLESDETLAAEDKLALAYSGWVLGSSNAITDLAATLRLWKGRYLILEYLRTEDFNRRRDLLAELLNVEGIDAERVAQMVPLLPMQVSTSGVTVGDPYRVEFTVPGTTEKQSYWVLLPQEYDPHHSYPTIVALKDRGKSGDKELLWWGGNSTRPMQSQRHGYIVIAPDYAAEDVRTHDYGADSHERVINALYNARKRFNIDSDRVFLSGHGMGGDAAFDIGMSRPDIFAGVMPITGICDRYCNWYWFNTEHVPWYVVGGELDRNSLNQNARILSSMMRSGSDVTYVEYIGRGYESYYEEIHKLFDWMALQRRNKFPKEFQAKVLRPVDQNHYWVKVEGLPRNVVQADLVSQGKPGRRISPMTLTATVRDNNPDRTVIQVSGKVDKTTLYFSPEFIDFDKRVNIRVSSGSRFNDFLRRDVEVMLNDLSVRGDRQKLYWAKLVFE